MKGRLAVRYDSAGHIIKQEVSEDKAQVTDIETLMEIAITNKAAGKVWASAEGVGEGMGRRD